MKIAGIVKSSLIDYPGKASTVIFLGGCNLGAVIAIIRNWCRDTAMKLNLKNCLIS